MGGIIVTNGYIYGSRYQKRVWCCLNKTNGNIIYSSDKFSDGSIIMAENLFYCYSEKGEVALVYADDKSFNVISKFPVILGNGPHFSHPVINNGRLYIRHGNALMVYNIKNK